MYFLHVDIRIVPIIGGMSAPKQVRLLTRHGPPDILVATPGRLWDLMELGNAYPPSILIYIYIYILRLLQGAWKILILLDGLCWMKRID